MKLSVIIIRDVDHNFIPDEFAQKIVKQSLPKSDFEVVFLLSEKDQVFYKDFNEYLIGAGVDLNVITDDFTNGRPGVINRSIESSRHEVLLFLADDFVPTTDLFKLHLFAHRDDQSTKLITYGPSLFPKRLTENSPFRRWLEENALIFGRDFLNQDQFDDLYFYIGNSAVKRGLIEQVGLFDERLKYETNDDYEFRLRVAKVGGYSKYLKDALAMHDHPVEENERYSQLKKAGYSSGIMCKNSISIFYLLTKSLVKATIFKMSFHKPTTVRSWKFNCEKYYFIGLFNHLTGR